MDPQALLQKVASTGISAAGKEDMIELACAFWHEGFVPDSAKIMQLDAARRQVAGYLTEVFSTFNVLDVASAKRLLEVAKQIKSTFEVDIQVESEDEIAGEWGLMEGIGQHLDYLLYYQTRHYVHKK